MANRRMFSREIMQSDSFIELSTEARLLYVYLNLNADDDGFVDNPKGLARLAGCKYDCMEELKEAGFVMEFDGSVFVVVHWMVHNYIPKDRYKGTRFTEEKAKLAINARKEYTYTDCIQPVYSSDTQVRLGKERIGKDRIGEEGEPPPPPSLEEVEKYCQENGLHIDARHFIKHYEASGWIDSKGRRVEHWQQKALEWERYEGKRRDPAPKRDYSEYDEALRWQQQHRPWDMEEKGQ